VSSLGLARDMLSGRTRIVVVGAGFAGFHCLRRLEKLLPPEAAEIVVVGFRNIAETHAEAIPTDAPTR